MNTSNNPSSAQAHAAALAAVDLINSATPIETTLLGVHPRLLADNAAFDQLRARSKTAPWSNWLANLGQQTEHLLTLDLPKGLMSLPISTMDVRGLGEQLIHLALMYRLTGDARCKERAAFLMERLADEPDWGHSLIFGHWARGFAFALDWLWNDFAPALRLSHVETLYARARVVFDAWASYRSGEPFGYTWNISAVVLGGLTAAAACLYAERPGIAPMANMAWEKMRCQSAALGPDGVSPEGVMYGGYYAGYLAISFLLAEQMFGFDMFETTPWLAAYARAQHAQTLPKNHWKPDDLFFNQGDAHGNAFGQEGLLRILAARLHDGAAAWFADAILESRAPGTGPLSFLLHDPAVQPATPATGAPFAHLEDFGIVVMRENWSGNESACAIKCGPNVGRHAAKRFSHPLGGGHMHPNNGELQIFSHGEWILRHPGYVFKETAYHNTLLLNGTGQIGEHSEWLEDLPYRLRRRYPFMARAEHHEAFDLAVADMKNAYPPELELACLRRSLLYIRPHSWLLLDAIKSAQPIMPEALFHTSFTMESCGPNAWIGRGAKAACSLRVIAPVEVQFAIEQQTQLHSGGKPQARQPLLRVMPKTAQTEILLAIIIQTAPADAMPQSDVAVAVEDNGRKVGVSAKNLSLTIEPFE